MSTLLAIESTCDETAAAIVRDGFDVRANIVATQVELHARYRGVVPEIASRAHIENILPVLRQCADKADCPLETVDAVAVAYRPGLIGSLLIGVTAAKTLAWALRKPLIGMDHVQAHLYSVMLETNRPPPMPAVGLVCSGGHTALYLLQDWTDLRRIGSTRDDAVGEAYDKVAAILGLGYPGGPIIDHLAARGSPTAFQFPRAMLERDSLDFSFSGLKTSVLYHVRGFQGKARGPESLSEGEIADVAASFQAACIETLIAKLRRAVKQTRAAGVIIGGGVSANQGLRAALREFDLPVFFPLPDYCTDNAAMSAGLAHVLFQQQNFSPLNLDAVTYSQVN